MKKKDKHEKWADITSILEYTQELEVRSGNEETFCSPATMNNLPSPFMAGQRFHRALSVRLICVNTDAHRSGAVSPLTGVLRHDPRWGRGWESSEIQLMFSVLFVSAISGIFNFLCSTLPLKQHPCCRNKNTFVLSFYKPQNILGGQTYLDEAEVHYAKPSPSLCFSSLSSLSSLFISFTFVWYNQHYNIGVYLWEGTRSPDMPVCVWPAPSSWQSKQS